MKRLVSVALVLLFTLPVIAQQKEMSAEEKAAMEAYMKAATPGDAHKKLDAMIGTWNAKVSYWPAPGAPAQVSEGVSENRWILGGRYVEQRFTGSMMGAPFEGLGYTGYDNVLKQYFGTWIDNMGTGMMTSTGKSDGEFVGTYADPMTGKEMKVQEKIAWKGADEHVFEMWGPAKSGKNFKMMEIVYTRKK